LKEEESGSEAPFDTAELSMKLETNLEIVMMGSAFRKIFVALVLLLTLLECKEKARVFLVEELETLLYTTLYKKFTQEMISLSKGKVQIIMTSNSPLVTEIFGQRVIQLNYLVLIF
jgi:predicted ATP-dependent endonuclease of OLD family